MSAYTLRHAKQDDAAAIASIQAENWRATYRGILSDRYLDDEVDDERLAFWRSRLAQGEALKGLVLLALHESVVVGFVSVYLDADPTRGAFLHNLHVRPELQGRGIGRHLIASAASWVFEQRPASKLHLWVFEANSRARQFYERLGAEATEREVKEAPGGSKVTALCYVWGDLPRLIRVAVAPRLLKDSFS
jgi:ribosomal protein S18 acetylase RimI-like enzyme